MWNQNGPGANTLGPKRKKGIVKKVEYIIWQRTRQRSKKSRPPKKESTFLPVNMSKYSLRVTRR